MCMGPPKLPLKQAVELAIDGILHELENIQQQEAALRVADEAPLAKPPVEAVTPKPEPVEVMESEGQPEI